MAKRTGIVFMIHGLLAGGVALAGELAREGPIDSSLCFGGPMHVIAGGAEHFGSYVIKGGTTAADMAFDSMAMECAGAFKAGGGKLQSAGYCVFRDASGDTIHGTDTIMPDGTYVWSFLGGTGKFEGITGSGTVERWGTLAPTANALRGCRRLVGTYKIR